MITRLEAAQRLGLSEREVTAVREHPAGHVATLNEGRPEMLITQTAARRYVPEVDDSVEPEPEVQPSATRRGSRR